MRRIVLSILATCLSGPFVSQAQVVTVRTVRPAEVKFALPLIEATAVRELAGGNVVVIDRLGIATYIGIVATGELRPIQLDSDTARRYRVPLRLLALPGDTTVLVDMWAGPVIISHDGRSVRAVPFKGTQNERMAFGRISQVDARGRVYRPLPSTRAGNAPGSAQRPILIERIDRSGGRRDTVAVQLTASHTSDGFTVGRSERSGLTPFATLDQWCVLPGGRLAVVTAFPYRVRFVDESGRVTVGPVLRAQSIPLTAALKKMWREDTRRLMPTIQSSPSGFTATFRRPAEPANWPDSLPPILEEALTFSPDGTLWIARTHPANQPAIYDLVNADGTVVTRVRLPERHRLVGIGARGLYLARQVEGREYLQRHPIP